MKSIKTILLGLTLVSSTVFLLSCGDDDPVLIDPVQAVISAFGITDPVSATGAIDGTSISVSVPFGTAVTAMTVDVTIPSGASVSPASGTAVDFSSPVTFTVTGNDENGEDVTANYTVTVNVAANDAKDITSFVFEAANNDGLDEDVTATIDGTAITAALPRNSDVTALVPTIETTGASVSPASGAAQDFSSDATYTVTAGDGTTQAYTVSVSVAASTVAFVGQEADVASLADDDAKAMAEWMQTEYGDAFTYLQASAINAAALEDVDVLVYYELIASGGAVGTSEADVPAALTETAVVASITAWAKAGGDLFLAGRGGSYIFDLDRIPEDDYFYQEAAADKGVENNYVDVVDGVPQTFVRGMKVDASTNSTDQSSHPMFVNVVGDDGNVNLFNADRWEVQLYWNNAFDPNTVITAGCCGDVALVTQYEEQTQSTKLASLHGVGDYFGVAAVEYLRTDENASANLNAAVPTDWKGHIIALKNTIIGYEWNLEGDALVANEYQSNIEQMTRDGIAYLAGLDND